MRQVYFPTPGEILLREFLEPTAISQSDVAAATVPPERNVLGLVDGSVEISAASEQRLSEFLGTSIGFWAALQVDFDSVNGRRRT